MATVIEKDKLGYEDVHFDTQGTYQTAQKVKSDGTYRSVQKINASHIPVTTACRAMVQADGSAIGTTDVDGTLQQIATDVAALAVPDGSTLVVSGSAGSKVLGIKALGVATASLAANAVTLAKLVAATAQGKLLGRKTAGSGTFEEVAFDGTTLDFPAGGNLMVKALGIAAAQLATDAVETAKIKDGQVTKGKLASVPSHYVVTAGSAVCPGGAWATYTASVTGVAATDIIMATPNVMADSVYFKTAVAATNQIVFTWSGNITSGCTMFYTVLRVAT